MLSGKKPDTKAQVSAFVSVYVNETAGESEVARGWGKGRMGVTADGRRAFLGGDEDTLESGSLWYYITLKIYLLFNYSVVSDSCNPRTI